MLTRAAMNEDAQEVEEDRVEVARGVAAREQEAEREVEEGGAAVGDRGDDGEQADQVEPAGVVAGLGAAELGGPPVDAARGRVGGDQLGQAEADAEHEGGQDRPAPGDGRRAAAVPAAREGGEAPGQDGDDGEADGEVGEAGPGAVQLLLVAHLGEVLLVRAQRCEVLRDLLDVDTFRHVRPPCSAAPGPGSHPVLRHVSKPPRRVTGMVATRVAVEPSVVDRRSRCRWSGTESCHASSDLAGCACGHCRSAGPHVRDNPLDTDLRPISVRNGPAQAPARRHEDPRHRPGDVGDQGRRVRRRRGDRWPRSRSP